MSDLTFNKVAGAVLATGLAIVGLKQVSTGVFAPEHVEKPGYLVEVAEETGGGAAADAGPPDWGTVLPTANVAAGEAAFAKCQSCHTIAAGGANGTGPNIHGVLGRKPAAVPGFAYSAPMVDFGAKNPTWNYDNLNEFLAAPQKYIAGTKMTFVGLKKVEDRINMIAYLRAQGGTLPIPAPDPSRAPDAAAPAEGAAPGAPAAGDPVATGSTAAPPAQPGGGPAPTGPSQQNASSAAAPTASSDTPPVK